MSSNASQFPEDGQPWKPAHELRGLSHTEPAIQFVTDFPVGMTLTTEQFDQWAHDHGYLNVPFGAPRQSDVWKAHLMRRHELKAHLIRSGSHPRMAAKGYTPFMISVFGKGVWEVRSPEAGIANDRTARKVQSLIRTRRKLLEYLLQSANWQMLPAYERAFAEAIAFDIDAFQRRVDLEADMLDAKFRQLRRKLEGYLKTGELPVQAQEILALDEHDEETGEKGCFDN